MLDAPADLVVQSGDRRLRKEIAGIGFELRSTLRYVDVPSSLVSAVTTLLNESARSLGYDCDAQLHYCSQRCRPRVATYDVGQSFFAHRDVPDPHRSFPMPAIHWLAVSVQLDDGDAYQGGDLVIIDEERRETIAASREKGVASVFLGHTPHEVRPVTSGRRRAFVFWGNMFLTPDASPAEAERFCDRNHLFGKDRSRIEALARSRQPFPTLTPPLRGEPPA